VGMDLLESRTQMEDEMRRRDASSICPGQEGQGKVDVKPNTHTCGLIKNVQTNRARTRSTTLPGHALTHARPPARVRHLLGICLFPSLPIFLLLFSYLARLAGSFLFLIETLQTNKQTYIKRAPQKYCSVVISPSIRVMPNSQPQRNIQLCKYG